MLHMAASTRMLSSIASIAVAGRRSATDRRAPEANERTPARARPSLEPSLRMPKFSIFSTILSSITSANVYEKT